MTAPTQELAFEELENLVSQEALKERQSNQPPPKPLNPYQDPDNFKDIPAEAFVKGSSLHKIVKKGNENIRTQMEAPPSGTKEKKGKQKKESAAAKSGENNAVNDDEGRERKRMALINKHNDYITNRVLRNILLERGYSCEALSMYNTSFEHAQHCCNQIDMALSQGYAAELAQGAVKGLAWMTETVVPEMGKLTPEDVSFSEFFMLTLTDERSPNRIMLEEVSINLKPWLPVAGFFQRCAFTYGSSVYQYRRFKKQCGGVITAENLVPPSEQQVEQEAEERLRQPKVSQAERDRINARLAEFN